ncbi:hypothetical protein [Hymenobacter terrestris]|uniref:Uncharacterized protein n=1 Tax=Hymenobacter terrestris TaxID=2748310 RepID=A0ABX2Q430_9BACT|nr:hypothetical protein [Hymenobacter terrestris]NVO85716.1 hypothetical protein [Hymenobacter terrestris]
MSRLYAYMLLVIALLAGHGVQAQQKERTLIVSALVGEVIDLPEKIQYSLFPAYSADEFQFARFLEFQSTDGLRSIILQVTLRNGDERTQAFTAAEFEALRRQIESRREELNRADAALLLDATYSVELLTGNSFIGVLKAQRANELDFQTIDLGLLTIRKADIKNLELLTATQQRRGWAPVGNGTRIFFAPTARSLRQGEGYVQNVSIFLLGANYGITDNFSMGVLIPILPGSGFTGLALTPKLTLPISEQFRAGFGALYFITSEGSAGVAYGAATYGSADSNATLGVGYLVSSDGIATTSPVVVVGGATRISRRVSLLSETYFVNGGLGGLAGARISGSRISGSLGFLYAQGYAQELGYIVPAYGEVTYRFGKTK